MFFYLYRFSSKNLKPWCPNRTPLVYSFFTRTKPMNRTESGYWSWFGSSWSISRVYPYPCPALALVVLVLVNGSVSWFILLCMFVTLHMLFALANLFSFLNCGCRLAEFTRSMNFTFEKKRAGFSTKIETSSSGYQWTVLLNSDRPVQPIWPETGGITGPSKVLDRKCQKTRHKPVRTDRFSG